jgi:hypothetical protein
MPARIQFSPPGALKPHKVVLARPSKVHSAKLLAESLFCLLLCQFAQSLVKCGE